MEVDIFNINDFIELNHLQQVTNLIYLNQDKSPTTGGLFSYNIFGLPGSKERKERFAYIDLGSKIMHPFIYKQLSQMDRRLSSIISGEKTFIIKNGQLIENDNGNTGSQWLFENIKKLKYLKTNSDIRNTKLKLLDKLNTNEIFTDKWLVIPAFYRDLNFAKASVGHISVDEVNSLYIKVMGSAEAIKRSGNGGFLTNSYIFKLQLALNTLYDFLTNKISGKEGYLRRYVIGKNIDYGARAVISTGKTSNAETYKDVEVKLSEIGIPLHMACAVFKPFIIKYVRELVADQLKGKTRFIFNEKTEEGADLYSENLSDTQVERLISLFIKSHEDRWNEIILLDKKGKKTKLSLYKNTLKRNITICDLLFIACYKTIKDKYVYNTRYPITSYQSTNPVKPVLITTENKITINFTSKPEEKGREGKQSVLGIIKNYPDINSKHWRDSAILDNTMTKIMGADFDGDQISIIGLFTKEANDEAKKLQKSIKSLVKPNGSPAREISNEAILSLYMLTK